MEGIIISGEGNWFDVDQKVGEGGTYIREANTNYAWRSYSVVGNTCYVPK
jgi:hypothetical protein